MVGVVSATGLLTPAYYHQETLNWQAQSYGQDLVDLCLIIPVLFLSSWLAYRGSQKAKSIWAGTTLYLLYTFVIYAFDIHFNSMFYFYCLGLGLAFYSFMYFLYTFSQQPTGSNFTLTTNQKITGYYLMIVAVLFYALWGQEIFPAVFHQVTPESLAQVGLPTNPVHVLDLSIILPAIFCTGLLLLRRHLWGWLLTPVILVFTLLMNLTIGFLMIVMDRYGFEANWVVTGIMFILAIFNVIQLIYFFNHPKPNPPQGYVS